MGCQLNQLPLMPWLSQLAELSLADNDMHDGGVAMALSEMPLLSSLDLSCNPELNMKPEASNVLEIIFMFVGLRLALPQPCSTPRAVWTLPATQPRLSTFWTPGHLGHQDLPASARDVFIHSMFPLGSQVLLGPLSRCAGLRDVYFKYDYGGHGGLVPDLANSILELQRALPSVKFRFESSASYAFNTDE